MSKVGVAVEGPSDLVFWRKFLHRTYRPQRFDVHMMSGRQKLVRDAAKLLDMFRDAHYCAGILIIDIDKDHCVTETRESFADEILEELKRDISQRYLHLCVAVAKIESWYLADDEAIRSVICGVEYHAGEYDPRWAKKKLGELHAQVGAVYNAIDFGARIATKFDPQRAAKRSDSFRIAWDRISNAALRGEEFPLFPP